MFKMPELLKYPEIKGLDKRPEIASIYSYLIASYKPGISILIVRNNEDVGIIVGDWNGNPSPVTDVIRDIVGGISSRLLELMRIIKLRQAQYYFSDDNRLVDVRLSANRFMGPGLLRDVFSKQTPVQDILEVAIPTEAKIAELRSNYGYRFPLVIKPTRYRFVGDDPTFPPLYATVAA